MTTSSPKKSSLIILVVTSVILSRIMFNLFDDPEGPNLLIVVVMSLFVYLLSLAVFLPNYSISHTKKSLLAFLAQLIIVTILYLVLK